MTYVVYKIDNYGGLVTTDSSVCCAVGNVVWKFRHVEPFAAPLTFEVVALKSDGAPDRRYVPTRFQLYPGSRIDCTARTAIGRLVRRAIRYM